MRILFELRSSPQEDPQAWRKITDALAGAGATQVREPQSELPGIAMAIFPEDVDPAQVVRRLEGQEGVGRVEVDSIRGTF